MGIFNMEPNYRHRFHAVLGLLIGLGLSGLSRAADSSTPDASSVDGLEPLQQLLTQGQYPHLLAKLNTALAAKTSTRDKATRYALLMLKGETLIRTNADESAADAFKAAALVGTSDHDIAIARANASLLKRSSLNKYQPKTKAAGTTALPAAIDIVDPASRKFAFVALFTDLITPAKPQVEATEKMTALPPIVNVAKQLADIRPLEIAGTGSDTDSKALLEKLGRQSSTLMNNALKTLDSQVTAIGKTAATRQKREKLNAGDISDALLPDDVSNLDSIISQATQIGIAAVTMQTTFGDADNFKGIETDSKKTIDNVSKLLKQYKHAP
jgi:hypothetical protein